MRKSISQISSILIAFLLISSPTLASAADLAEMPGLQVWLKSDNVSKDDNNRVTAWPDSSGKGNNFSQDSNRRQPIHIEDRINGFPSIRFMGNDFLDSSSISALNTSKISAFIVFKMKVPPLRQDVFSASYRSGAGKSSDELWGLFGEFPYFGAFTHKSDGRMMSVMKKTGRNWSVCSMVWNSSTSFNAWIDGAAGKSLSGANANPSVSIKTRIGAITDNPRHCSKVEIAEIILFNKALPDADRISVEAYLQDKYFGEHESPALTAVSAMGDPRKVIITFNEGIDETEARIATNYKIDNGIGVSEAVLLGNENRVELTLSNSLQKGTMYLLKINNIKDIAGNVIKAGTEVPLEYADIPADDMVLWLRGDSFVATDDEGGVVSWEDQSGNSNRATTVRRKAKDFEKEKDKEESPILSASALNGRPAISFSGEKCVLRCASIPELDTDKLTWFIVLKTNSPDRNQSIISNSYSEGAKNSSDEMWGSYINDNYLFAHARDRKGRLVSVKHPIDDKWHIQSAAWKSNDAIEAFMDGTTKMTSSGADAVPEKHNFLLIGGKSKMGQHPFNGGIAEIIVYSDELTDADRLRVEAYLENKYFAPEDPNKDSDGNGIPDWWELKYFGKIGIDPHADPDGDGVDNITEFKQHRHPNAGSKKDTENRLKLEVLLPSR
ncbi:MAG: LamG-like jellyroll fold domain-containing protein [Victivallales bacterium]